MAAWLYRIYVAGGLILTGIALAAFVAASLLPQQDIHDACAPPNPNKDPDHDEPHTSA